jgi:hypothetical protein
VALPGAFQRPQVDEKNQLYHHRQSAIVDNSMILVVSTDQVQNNLESGISTEISREGHKVI